MQIVTSARVSRAFFLAASLWLATGAAAQSSDRDNCHKLTGEAAIKACTAAIGSGKFKAIDLSNLYFRRGTNNYNLDENDRAIQDFNAALIHNPASSAAYSGRASVYADKKDYDRALSDFNMAIKIDAENAYAYENRGDLFMQLGKFKEAVSDYDSALKFSQDNAWSIYGRGMAKMKSGDKSGEADIAAAMKLNAKIAEEFGEIVGVK